MPKNAQDVEEKGGWKRARQQLYMQQQQQGRQGGFSPSTLARAVEVTSAW